MTIKILSVDHLVKRKKTTWLFPCVREVPELRLAEVWSVQFRQVFWLDRSTFSSSFCRQRFCIICQSLKFFTLILFYKYVFLRSKALIPFINGEINDIRTYCNFHAQCVYVENNLWLDCREVHFVSIHLGPTLGPNVETRSTQPCIPPGSLNRVPASAGVRAGMSPLPGGR